MFNRNRWHQRSQVLRSWDSSQGFSLSGASLGAAYWKGSRYYYDDAAELLPEFFTNGKLDPKKGSWGFDYKVGKWYFDTSKPVLGKWIGGFWFGEDQVIAMGLTPEPWTDGPTDGNRLVGNDWRPNPDDIPPGALLPAAPSPVAPPPTPGAGTPTVPAAPWINATFYPTTVRVGEPYIWAVDTVNATSVKTKCTGAAPGEYETGPNVRSEGIATKEMIGTTTCTTTARGPGGETSITYSITVVPATTQPGTQPRPQPQPQSGGIPATAIILAALALLS